MGLAIALAVTIPSECLDRQLEEFMALGSAVPARLGLKAPALAWPLAAWAL